MRAPRLGAGGLIALFTILALALAGLVPPPHAAAAPGVPDPGQIDPDAQTALIIHKLLQPQEFGEPATGHEDPSILGTPVAGVTFQVKRVPDVDLTTDQGWQAALAMTVPEALAATEGQPVAGEGVTDEDGTVTLDLKVGLYLVEETAAAPEVVPGTPFLVPLPLDDQGGWLYAVHVYPKNAVVDAVLEVADRSAVTCGDRVSWTSLTAIPHQRTISSYVVFNVIAPGLQLVSDPEPATVELTDGATLTADDYVVEGATVDGQQAVRVTFTESGRNKLVEARSAVPDARVQIKYETTVLTPGIHQNQVRLQAGNTGLVADTAETRFGPLKIRVHQKDKPQNVIPGAVFELYLTAQDAADRLNPIPVGGKTRLTTDQDGEIVAPCLRFSDFADGLDLASDDPAFRYYFAQPVSYPEGWKGDEKPLAGTVGTTIVDQAVVLEFQVWKSAGPPAPPRPNPDLPITGVQVAGVGLLAVVLLGAGSLMVLRRRAPRGGKSASDDSD